MVPMRLARAWLPCCCCRAWSGPIISASVEMNDRRFNMTQIPMSYGLILAGTLFSLGLIGLLVRRNLIFVLMSLEVMLNAAGLAFVVAGARWHQAEGQVVFLLIL